MFLARALARLIGFVWLVALAALGLGVAAYCLDGLVGLGAARPDRLLDLPSVRRHVGRFLHQLGAHGPVATLSLLCGVGAVLAGLILIAGLIRAQERSVPLEDDTIGGTLSARLRPLRSMLRALANDPPEAHVARRPTVSRAYGLRRHPRVTVHGEYIATEEDPQRVRETIEHALQPLAAPFGLLLRIRMTANRPRRRVR